MFISPEAEIYRRYEQRQQLFDWFEPLPYQKEAYLSTKPIQLIEGGNRCLGGETEIFDPIVSKSKRVCEIDGNFHVYAWDGEKKVIACAEKPFKKKVDDLYEVSLSNGEHFVCSMSHVVLTSYGYRTISSVLQEYGGVLLSSISESVLKARVLDVRSYSKTIQDFPNDYLVFPYFCDGRFLKDLNNDLDVSPLQDGVRERIYCAAYGREDVREHKAEHNHLYQLCGRLSNRDGQHHYEGLSSGTLSRVSYKPYRLTLGQSEVFQQSKLAFFPQKSTGEYYPLGNKPYYANPSNTSLLAITSMVYKRKDVKWDFTVPKYHNYECGGIFHHNSGKSHLAVAKIVAILTDKHPTVRRNHPIKVRVVATVLREGAQGVILEKFRELLPTIYLRGGNWSKAFKSMDNLIYLRNGDIIQLMANSQDIETHRGDSIDIVMMDEEPDEKIFDENMTRLADKAGIMILSMTPHNGMTWSYKKLVKASRYNERIGYYHLDTLSNYKIKRRSWIEGSAVLSDKEFAIRIKGERIANEGLVYFMVQDRTHVIQPFSLPLESQLFLGVDFGINNPHAGTLWAVTPDNKIYVVDEYYETGRTVAQNGEAQGSWVKSRWGEYRLRWVACDPNSGAQRNEQTNETNMQVFAKAFRNGYQKTVPVYPADRHKGCAEHRINKMREFLTLKASGLPDLMIFANCIHHMNEFEGYVWGSRKDENLNKFERPKDSQNHLMNACEYVAERNPKFVNSIHMIKERTMYTPQYGNV